MRERPILFSAPMICAILDGRKSQTRRVVTRCGLWESTGGEGLRPMPEACPYGKPGDRLWVKETWADVNYEGAPGIAYRADDDVRDLMEDRSFLDRHGGFNYEDLRFKFVEGGKSGNHFAVWSSDLIAGTSGRWRSPLHMPRWVSRITLEVTGVRVERLQDISDQDAIAEGVDDSPGVLGDDDIVIGQILNTFPTIRLAPVARFVLLWDSINGENAGVTNWNANPWVWVVEFKRVKP